VVLHHVEEVVTRFITLYPILSLHRFLSTCNKCLSIINLIEIFSCGDSTANIFSFFNCFNLYELACALQYFRAVYILFIMHYTPEEYADDYLLWNGHGECSCCGAHLRRAVSKSTFIAYHDIAMCLAIKRIGFSSFAVTKSCVHISTLSR